MSGDVSRVGGIVISESVARFLVAAIDELVKLSQARGATPNGRLVDLRNQLYGCCLRPGAVPDSSGVAWSGRVLELDSSAVVDTAAAGRELGITAGAVALACRKKRLPGTFRAGRWWVRPEALAEYRSAPKRKTVKRLASPLA